MSIVTKPGFYGGKFLKAGQFYDDSAVVSEQQADHGAGEAGEQDDPGAARAPNLGGMTKDETIAYAKAHGVDLKSDDTKAEIRAKIEAAE